MNEEISAKKCREYIKSCHNIDALREVMKTMEEREKKRFEIEEGRT